MIPGTSSTGALEAMAPAEMVGNLILIHAASIPPYEPPKSTTGALGAERFALSEVTNHA